MKKLLIAILITLLFTVSCNAKNNEDELELETSAVLKKL